MVLGASVTVADLEGDPHALLARLREQEPVSWLPAIDGWLVTRRDLALEAMRDAGRFTVHDPRFTTAQVVGESMLSLDGAEHTRHRAPFVAPLRLGEVRRRLADAVAAEAERLADELAPRGEAELRRGFAGPLAAAAVTHALGLDGASTGAVLGWYDAIVAAVTDLSAGRPAGPEAARAVEELGAAVDLDAAGLSAAEVRSNVAVLLFGGIETTEGMIANALLHVLAEPVAREQLPAAVEESLRLEPAAAVIDRYATRDTSSAGRRSRRATWCGSRSPPPTATRRSSRSPIASTPAARTPAATSRSPPGRTCAWGCTSRGSRRTSRWRRCSSGCRASSSRGPPRSGA